MKTFDLQILDYPPSAYSAVTRSKVHHAALVSFTDTLHCSSKEFRGIPKVWCCPIPEIGDYVYIPGAYGVAASQAGDLVEIAENLADLIYMADGTALEFGIRLDRVWSQP